MSRCLSDKAIAKLKEVIASHLPTVEHSEAVEGCDLGSTSADVDFLVSNYRSAALSFRCSCSSEKEGL